MKSSQIRCQPNPGQSPLVAPKNDNGPDFDETDLSPGAWPPPKPLRIPLGIGAGLVAGLILAFSLDVFDDRIRWREDAERATGLPVITEVPRLGREQPARHSLCVADDSSEMMVTAERYRAARTDLRFLLDGLESKRTAPVVLVTSPGPGEGKSTTSANLAAVFAEADLKVLAVDGDFRRPSLGKFLRPVPNLVDPSGPSETCVAGLRFIGVPSTGERPEADIEHVKAVVDSSQNDYDIIVVDTPPILTTNDAADLLGIADLVVLVLRSGKTRQRPAMMAAELFERYRAEVAGVILNACDRQQMDAYHGYGYGYGYTRRAERKRV